MQYYVGQKVVCVDVSESDGINDGSDRVHDVPQWIKEGNVYVLRWIGVSPYPPDRKYGLTVRLEGIFRPQYATQPQFDDMPFLLSRFRPLIEKKTDIAVFQQLLVTKKIEERV